MSGSKGMAVEAVNVFVLLANDPGLVSVRRLLSGLPDDSDQMLTLKSSDPSVPSKMSRSTLVSM